MTLRPIIRQVKAWRNILTFGLLPALLGLNACADYRLHYAPDALDWRAASPDSTIPLDHTLYLVGSLGQRSATGERQATLRLLKEKLAMAPARSSTVFLGDNFVGEGEEAPLDLWALEGYKGRMFFLPGDNDWRQHGLAGLRHLRDHVEATMGRRAAWLPQPGCGGPAVVELSDNLVLILVDSQWWLGDWRGEPEINQDCEVKSRTEFHLYFEEAVKSNRDKQIVVAMHHALASNGLHGGHFTWRQHLFPLADANEKLWIPLPLIGSLYPFYRSAIGARQDLARPEYQRLRKIMIDAARKNGSLTFLAGHERNMQLLEEEGQHFVLSGADPKATPTRGGGAATFAYAAGGIAQLDYYADGSAWVRFWIPSDSVVDGVLVFRRQIKSAQQVVDENGEKTPSSFPSLDSAEYVTPLGRHDYRKTALGRLLWGRHYRDAYATPVPLPALDLSRYQGGLKPKKRGGGYQTNALRLQASDKRQFNLRSIEKDPTRVAPYPFSTSKVVLDLIQDSFSASHPLSAMPLPALQSAAGLYHTNPVAVYLPRQSWLGDFNHDFGDGLYLLEERPAKGAWESASTFGNPEDLIGTPEVLQQWMNESGQMIDQDWTLRARLFDLWVGDWDRHDDQWRWAISRDENDVQVIRPVPRDRDQAFSHYDGLVFALARLGEMVAKPLRPFRGHVGRVWWSAYGARHFDHTFLNEKNSADWEREARHLQGRLDDELIEAAFREAWPRVLYEIDAPRIIEALMKRRDRLPAMAAALYRKQAAAVDVVGTNQVDTFLIERRDNGELHVRVFQSEGNQSRLRYERVFLPRETQEIRLYGLHGDDVFHLVGQARQMIRIRIIGGLGRDVVRDLASAGAVGKLTIVHDSSNEPIELKGARNTYVRLSDDPEYNIYNRRSRDYEYDYWSYAPNASVNPDDGILMGVAAHYTRFGFKKWPYASRHSFAAKAALATQGWELRYIGDWVRAFDEWGLRVDASYRSPLFTSNFYGLGNETPNLEPIFGPDYHRVRVEEWRLAPLIYRQYNPALRFGFGPMYQRVRVERSPDRFVDDYADAAPSSLSPDFFKGQRFLGARLSLDFSNLDEQAFPTRGFQGSLEAGLNVQLDKPGQFLPYIEGFAAGYQAIDGARRLVLAHRVGGARLLNRQFEFYQAATLGGEGPNSNFRGFRRDRFSGRAALYQNLDLRWKAFDSFNALLPFSLGFFAGFDLGRVWWDESPSRRWHHAFGGGIFLNPLDMLSVQFMLFQGDDEPLRFTFRGSFFF